MVGLVASLPAARTLDAARGSRFVTRHLSGVVGVDRRPAMVAQTRPRLSHGAPLVADALALPFAGAAFSRVLTGHLHGHLPAGEREVFLAEAG